jgi:F0F1-type ATP synthase membrane subunit b/b'
MVVVWGAISFALGVLVGALATVAAFKAAVAVLGNRADTIERRITELDEKVESFREKLADVLLNMAGARRWSDPGHDRSGEK